MTLPLAIKMEDHLHSKMRRAGAYLSEAVHDENRRLRTAQRTNLQTLLRNPWREISGSFGDLGTLLPIMIALSNNHSISLPATLVFSGLANIFTGIFFGIPLPVQPMKAIAAVALPQKFSEAETMSAGLFVAAVIGFFSLSGLLGFVTKMIPVPVIKGIQVGTGLSLVIYAGGLLNLPHAAASSRVLSLIIAFLAFVALLWRPFSAGAPYALIILLLGIIIPCVGGPFGHGGSTPLFSIWNPHISAPSPAEFSTGALQAGLGQVPLTALNSVIAVTFLSADLLPQIQAPSVTSMGLSVMIMNLVGCWFGAMPVCHGSGGLAAQYRFGARSGASIIFLGLLKLILGLFAGHFTASVLWGFPTGLLAVMVVAAGLELANVGESLNTAGARDLRMEDPDAGADRDMKMQNLPDEEKKRRWAIMLITVAGILAFKNDAVGFLAGMLCHWSFKLEDRWSRREGRIRLGDERSAEGSRIAPQEEP